jgi:methylenetetrahydrofolate dehydrogenase (NADP+) / methenyltetrahydrofolate cyclohydrolase
MILLDGKVASNAIKEQITEQVQARKAAGKSVPHLAAILVGTDAASQTYVASKVKNCEELGFKSSLFTYDSSLSQEALVAKIEALNIDSSVHGILVQLPLPKHIDAGAVINSINPTKDVDGFHPINVGNMAIGQTGYVSATPYGIMLLLQYFKIDTAGKNCVVLGRSNIVGTPMSILLSRNTDPGNCTVTICHSKTENLQQHLLQADIIIAAIGIPHFVKREMVKPEAVIIDVGINRIESDVTKSGYRLVGDVDFENVKDIASAMTPVPGGVGLMTIVALMKNTLQAADIND